MAKFKFSKTSIEREAKPHPDRDTFYWDTLTRGLGMRVTPKGAMTFVVQGRPKGAPKDVRITIGSYGAWLLDSYDERDARRRAQELRQKFEDGIDPREASKQAEVLRKQEAAAQVTLGTLARDYLALGRLKPTTAKWYDFYITKVFHDWADLPVVSITRDMVKERHAKLMEGGLAGLHPDANSKREAAPAPASANASMVVLRTLFNFAIEDLRLPNGRPVISENPVAVMRKRWAPEGDRTERYIPVEKVGAVWNLLQELRMTTVHGDTRSGIDLTIMNLLCGGRISEAARLRWSDVYLDEQDPARSYWHLKERKAGKPIKLPLPTQIAAMLKDRPRVPDNEHVFASRGRTGHITDPRTTMEKVSAVAGLHLSNHDLRRTFSEVSVKLCRIERFRGDLLIGHKPDPRDVGANSYLDLTDLRWLYPEVQQVADYIEGQGKVAEGANVVPLRA
jgi:integrase